MSKKTLGRRTDGKPELKEEEFVGFALDKFGRNQSSPFLGMRFVDLDEDTRVKFYQYNFNIRKLYTSDSGDDSELRSMFTRLNR